MSVWSPAAHGVQDGEPAVLTLFPLHDLQLPPLLEYVPARQSMQLFFSLSEVFPAGHTLHIGDPSTDVIVPALHVRQDFPSADALPGLQRRHSLLERVDSYQALQLRQLTAPALDEYCPIPQLRQLFPSDQYVPAGQATHAVPRVFGFIPGAHF